MASESSLQTSSIHNLIRLAIRNGVIERRGLYDRSRRAPTYPQRDHRLMRLRSDAPEELVRDPEAQSDDQEDVGYSRREQRARPGDAP